MTLLADLDAFFQEHKRGGDLDSGLDGDRVWMVYLRRGDQSVRGRWLTNAVGSRDTQFARLPLAVLQ